MGSPKTVRLKARDVSGQKMPHSVKAPADGSIEELVSNCLSRMELPRNDTENRPITYHAFRLSPGSVVGSGEHLNPGDMIGEVLEDDDTVVLHPDISAGAGKPW
jgi:hypothetical protein